MNLDTSFCMETGQIKTGDDKQDTYIKMLQEVVRVTAPVAYGIASDYPSVMSLVQAMRRHGPSCLENIEVSRIRRRALCMEQELREFGSCRNAPTRMESAQTGKLGLLLANDCIGYLRSWILHVRTSNWGRPWVRYKKNAFKRWRCGIPS